MKWIIYKISDDWKEIVVEETSTESEWADFREKLLNAKSKDRKGKEGIGGRYAVFDVQYELESGEGTRYVIFSILVEIGRDLVTCEVTNESCRNKITFISWCPDDAPQYVCSSSHSP
jgi:cofilin